MRSAASSHGSDARGSRRASRRGAGVPCGAWPDDERATAAQDAEVVRRRLAVDRREEAPAGVALAVIVAAGPECPTRTRIPAARAAACCASSHRSACRPRRAGVTRGDVRVARGEGTRELGALRGQARRERRGTGEVVILRRLRAPAAPLPSSARHPTERRGWLVSRGYSTCDAAPSGRAFWRARSKRIGTPSLTRRSPRRLSTVTMTRPTPAPSWTHQGRGSPRCRTPARCPTRRTRRTSSDARSLRRRG